MYHNSSSVEQGIDFIFKNNISSYQSANLFDLINRIGCFIKRNEIMGNIWVKEDPYLNKCTLMISLLADNIKKLFYGLLKSHLKFEVIPISVLYQKLKELANIVRCEEIIKREILNIMLQNKCFKDKLNGKCFKRRRHRQFYIIMLNG